MFLKQLFARRAQLHSNAFKASFLQSNDYLMDQTPLNSVWFKHNEGSFSVRIYFDYYLFNHFSYLFYTKLILSQNFKDFTRKFKLIRRNIIIVRQKKNIGTISF